MSWVMFILKGEFEEGQVPLRGRGYMAGHEGARGKVQCWNNGGAVQKHGTRIEALSGEYIAMFSLQLPFEGGDVRRVQLIQL